MDRLNLADRLRAIIKTPGPKGPGLLDEESSGLSDDVEVVLGGDWCHRDGLSCLIVERRYAPEIAHGCDSVATIASRLSDAAAEVPLITGSPGPPPFVFFDLETTGLSGGAGTYAFLVGCGSFDEQGGFRTRQFVLLRHADERPLLQMVAAELAAAGTLVSFNGKSFDAPLIETRYFYHRLAWTGGSLPHLDVLHPSRHFWSDEGGEVPCSLHALETAILGAQRSGDVAGADIPARYFQFVRSGDARPLRAVLEHNRLDLLSLAGLTSRMLDLVRKGPGGVRHAREALALGRIYARAGLEDRARDAYQHACGDTRNEASTTYRQASTVSIRMTGLRSLALLSRRGRQYEAAAAYWRELLTLPACPAHLVREASQALAIHHEHRARDLPAARAFALRCFDGQKPAWDQAIEYRLARIERKMNSGSERTRPIERRPLFPS